MIRTLDVEFSEWCDELLADGMDPIDFLRLTNQCEFVWAECRRRCANLCVQHGLKGMGMAIMRNEDGTMLEGWKGD